jgi:hypothetical protein
MVWFYKRDQASLSVETRFDNATAEYVAIVVRPDGQQTERFLTREAFREWLMALEQQLQHEHWVTDGPVHVLPDGWPHKTAADVRLLELHISGCKDVEDSVLLSAAVDAC